MLARLAYLASVLGVLGATTSVDITIGQMATQLGVKVPTARADERFDIGVQFTSILVNPARLASFGIKGMHAGARVVAARIALDRVYVEADELEPPVRSSTHLEMDADGHVTLQRGR